MSTNKVTDTAAASIWGLLCACLPPECKLPSFPAIKRMLARAKDQLVRRIDICKNDCIAYYNTRHLPGAKGSRHWHRTKCPVCGEPRYIDDPVTGLQQSVKVVYHFPLANFVRSLFRRKDLVKFLFWDCGEHPPGHLTRSRGFRKKVIENPHMNKYDHMCTRLYNHATMYTYVYMTITYCLLCIHISIQLCLL